MQRPSLKRQFLTGASASAMAQVSTVAIQMLLLPVLLFAWGDHRYGAWLILSAIPSYFGLADFGLTSVLANETTMRMGSGDVKGAISASQSGWLLLLIIMAVLAPVVAALCLWPMVGADVIAAAGGLDEMRIAIVALASATVASFALGIAGGAMRSVGKMGTMTNIGSVARLAEAAALALAALGGFSFAVAALCSMAARMLPIGLGCALFYRKHMDFSPSLRHADAGLLRRLLGPSMGSVAYTLAQLVSVQGMIVAVGSTLGPQAVVIFSATRTFSRIGRMAASVANIAIEPIFALVSSGAQQQRFGDLQRQMVRHSVVAAAIYFVGAMLVGPLFIPWWTHGVVRADLLLLFCLILTTALEIIWMAIQTPLIATNRHLAFSILFMLASIVTLGGYYLTAALWGLLSAGIWSVILGVVVLVSSLLAIRRASSTQPGAAISP